MPDYLLAIAGPPAASVAQVRASLAAHAAYRARLGDALRDWGLFRPAREGVRVRGAAPVMPASALVRFYVLAAADRATAEALAAACPREPADSLELRAVMAGQIVGGKLDRPGKTFAFAVLDAAADEAAWVRVMDDVEAATRTRFDATHFAGGVRLHAPSFEVRNRPIDGPFLEAKEVIGGLFFLRLAGLEDAIAWARASEFAPRCTLEIRELWRT